MSTKSRYHCFPFTDPWQSKNDQRRYSLCNLSSTRFICEEASESAADERTLCGVSRLGVNQVLCFLLRGIRLVGSRRPLLWLIDQLSQGH